MRVFILEDDPVRHKVFRVRYAAHDLTIADGYWPAIATIASQEPFDLYCLDHDIMLSKTSGGFNGSQSMEKTGNDFVDHLILHLPKNKWPKNIIIHSWNPPGAMSMENKLKEAGMQVVREMFSHKP